MGKGNALLNALNKQVHNNSVNQSNTTSRHPYRYIRSSNARVSQPQHYNKPKPSITTRAIKSKWPLHSKILLGASQCIFFIVDVWYFCTVHFVDSMHPILSIFPLLMIMFALMTEPAIFNYDKKSSNLEADSWGLAVIAIIATALSYVLYQF